MMRWLGRTDLRVLLAILVTALVPLIGSVLAARTIVARISATAFQPEFGAHLDRALTVYADLAKAMKDGLRHEGAVIASSSVVRDKAFIEGGADRKKSLSTLAAAHPRAAVLSVERCEGDEIDRWERPAKVDPTAERAFTVRYLVSPGADPKLLDPQDAEPSCGDPAVFRLAATFAVARERFDELEDATAFAQAYHEVERDHREDYLDATYRNAFVVLLVITIVIGLVLGLFVAAPVTRGVRALSVAMVPVAAGDLSVRVAASGKSEVADLGRAFNRMLEELDHSRATMEFLQRVGQWQKVARRLAHEIKNPLTPIQLAVEECHRRYRGNDPELQKMLDTMLEVVTEEVTSLRRLVTEFSGFARLPRAALAPGDLSKVLSDERAHFSALAGEGSVHDEDASLFARAVVKVDVPESPMPAAIDREMLHRALSNVIKNAAQALRDARGSRADETSEPCGCVHVGAHTRGGEHVITIDDNGPGIRPEIRATMFDPYVTTKRDGTGLGLTIVKKIMVDHGGTIEVGESPEGGARIRFHIPVLGTPAQIAATKRAAFQSDEDNMTGAS
ncbi:MAG: HAMP domain-containing protein [Polyangiaceae bacterium]|nr:HAMP domain-containing protein [Polyangiaceae bacterium]